MGAKVKGAGSSKIEIEGVKKLKDVSYNIMPDRIETGTFLCLAAINRSNLIINNINETHIIPIIDKLEEAGCIKGYLIPHYDILHTQGSGYLVDDIQKYLAVRGVSI